MGRRPRLTPLGKNYIDPTYSPPEPVNCPGCGYPSYDLDSHACEVSNQFSTTAEVIHRVNPPEPTEKGNYTRLQAAADNVLKSAHAYRTTKDWVLRDAMLADAEQIKALCTALIYEVEGLK